MTRVSLHMVSLCALLLLTGRTVARRSHYAALLSGPSDGDPPDPHGPKCITEEQLRSREDKFLKRHPVTELSAQNSNTTCAQVLEEMRKEPHRYKEMSHRSLSPWEYSVHRDDERVPAEISVARCLCEGCIIDLRENHDYNSVTVCAERTVLRRKPCPGDPQKYMVKTEVITIPVACTCLRPIYSQ